MKYICIASAIFAFAAPTIAANWSGFARGVAEGVVDYTDGGYYASQRQMDEAVRRQQEYDRRMQELADRQRRLEHEQRSAERRRFLWGE